MARVESDGFYSTRAWRRCRDAFMQSKHYVCERCGNVAAIAHHKKYVTAANVNNPNITLSWDNLESVCLPCHNRIHGTTNATAEGFSFNADGNLNYIPPIK